MDALAVSLGIGRRIGWPRWGVAGRLRAPIGVWAGADGAGCRLGALGCDCAVLGRNPYAGTLPWAIYS